LELRLIIEQLVFLVVGVATIEEGFHDFPVLWRYHVQESIPTWEDAVDQAL
jgi:hypothetical protein